MSLVAYPRSEATRERRRQDEILGREGGSRRDSPPPPDRRTHHRGRTMLDESETYDDRRRLRVRDRASRGASRDYGGVRGGNPQEGEASRGVDGAMAPVFRNYASRVRREGWERALVVDVGRLATTRDRPSALSALSLLPPFFPCPPPLVLAATERGLDTTLALVVVSAARAAGCWYGGGGPRTCARATTYRESWVGKRLVAIRGGTSGVEGQEESGRLEGHANGI